MKTNTFPYEVKIESVESNWRSPTDHEKAMISQGLPIMLSIVQARWYTL